MDKIAEGYANEFVANEFVVVTPHRDLVMQRLTGTKATVERESPELGLSLVRLDDVDRAADDVRRQREEAHIDAPPLPAGVGGRLPLERLMADLRAIFKHQFGGWAPTMGKNRVMRGIQLFPYTNYGGETVPQPVEGKTRPDTLTGDATAGERARVMVLDTQVYPHEYLTGRYIADPDSILSADATPQWWAGHATFVSGLIVQRAPAVQLGIESVLTVGGGSPSVWDVALAMVRSARLGADIFNVSFGCYTIDGQPPLVLERAVARLTPSIVVVAAAGNHGAAEAGPDDVLRPTTPMWPAAFDDVVAVGANTPDGKPAPFSPEVPWIDFMAPGFDVESTYLKGEIQRKDDTATFTGMARWSGTSFAAAAVSGAIASRTEPGRRGAHEALEELRSGAYGDTGAGIDRYPGL